MNRMYCLYKDSSNCKVCAEIENRIALIKGENK